MPGKPATATPPAPPNPQARETVGSALSLDRPDSRSEEPPILSAWTPPPAEGGFSGRTPLIVLALGVAGAVLVFAIRAWATSRRQEETIQTAAAEIESNATALHIKRKQLVQPNHYGTISLDRWEAEKRFYIEAGFSRSFGPKASKCGLSRSLRL